MIFNIPIEIGTNIMLKKLRIQYRAIALGAFIAIFMISHTTSAQTIAKCQDEEGNWHYGNFAAEECEKSVVSKLNQKGDKVGQVNPPPTAEEVAAANKKKAANNAKKKSAADQRKKDNEIFHIYGSEEVIVSTRDRKLASIDKNITIIKEIKSATQKDIESLKARKQTNEVKKYIAERHKAIAEYDHVIKINTDERNKLAKKYEILLTEFRAAVQRKNK